MKLEIEILLDPIQLRILTQVVKESVAKEVTRQLKFKRNEVLNNERL